MVNNEIRPGMHTFRVAVPAAGSSTTSEYRILHRRSHTKSRAGCLACRMRRKKCDEQRPKCGYCVTRNVNCDYARPLTMLQTSPAAGHLWPGATAPLVLALKQGQSTALDLYLLKHFLDSTVVSFKSEWSADLYRSKVVRLAQESSYLMHAMLSLSACHLQYLDKDAKQYRGPEALHCHFASQQLCSSVANINDPKDSDAVLTTSMLLNSLTFCVADYRDEEAAALGNSQPKYGWLRVQIGLTSLLSSTSPYHPESFWLPLFVATETFAIEEPAESDLGLRLAKFCNVDLNETEHSDPYSELLIFLQPVLNRPPSERYMLVYLHAVGTITSSFIDLMESYDTRALLIFAHWLALMTSIDQWWCAPRTRRECWKICQILFLQLPAEDLDLLALPAHACRFIWQPTARTMMTGPVQ